MPAFLIASSDGVVGEVDGVHALAGALAGDDAGALADPLVAGVDRLDEVVVRHDEVAAGGAEAEDAGELRAVRLLERGLVMRCSVDQVVGGGEVVGGLDRDGRHALEAALGETDEGAGRGKLDDAGDAGVRRTTSMVRSQRTGDGDLADDQVDEQARRR